MDIKNSVLLGNLMSKSGGGVEFKTSIYSQGNAYIEFNKDKHIDRFYTCDICFIVKSISTYGILRFGRYYDDYGIGSMRVVGETSGSFRTYLTTNATGTETSVGDVVYDIDNIFNNVNIYNSSSNWEFPIIRLFYSGMTENFLLKYITFYGENNTKVAELKPVIVNGESGIYDTVTETFYGNANSVGSLVCE